MDSDNIKRLLDKYWEGESTLGEEAQLRSYFNREDVAEELKPYQPLFRFFHLEREKHLDEEFDEKMMKSLQDTGPQRTKIRSVPYYLMRIAAACLFLIAAYFIVDRYFSEKEDSIVKIPTSPYDAYAETKAALLLVSTKLNKGTRMANKGVAEVNKATKVIKN